MFLYFVLNYLEAVFFTHMKHIWKVSGWKWLCVQMHVVRHRFRRLVWHQSQPPATAFVLRPSSFFGFSCCFCVIFEIISHTHTHTHRGVVWEVGGKGQGWTMDTQPCIMMLACPGQQQAPTGWADGWLGGWVAGWSCRSYCLRAFILILKQQQNEPRPRTHSAYKWQSISDAHTPTHPHS